LGMKHLGEKFFGVLGITCLIVSTNLEATVAINLDCPDKFIGVVNAINSPEAPSDPYVKSQVELKVLKTLSGNLSQDEKKSFEILKYSAEEIEKGESYEVSMRGPWLCYFKKIE